MELLLSIKKYPMIHTGYMCIQIADVWALGAVFSVFSKSSDIETFREIWDEVSFVFISCFLHFCLAIIHIYYDLNSTETPRVNITKIKRFTPYLIIYNLFYICAKLCTILLIIEFNPEFYEGGSKNSINDYIQNGVYIKVLAVYVLVCATLFSNMIHLLLFVIPIFSYPYEDV